MDRQAIEKLAAGNRVDLAAVHRVKEALERLAEAGFGQPEGYSISPPLGRPADVAARQTFANAQTDDTLVDGSA